MKDRYEIELPNGLRSIVTEDELIDLKVAETIDNFQFTIIRKVIETDRN